MVVKQQEMRKKIAEKNQLEGEKFLAENARKEGVKTLPSGLQYKVLTPGNGKSPKENDSVKMKVKGTLLDGTTIDSVYEGEEWMPGDPVSFEVTTAIPGWKEALLLMKVGAKWQLSSRRTWRTGSGGTGAKSGRKPR